METANLRDFLENLFDCSSLVSRCTFSSETSLFLFTEAAVTPVGNQSQVDLFACTSTSFWIQIFFYKSDTISSLWHPWWELDVLTFQWQVNYWRVDQRHQRHVSRLCHPSLSPDYLSARFAPQFFFFSPMLIFAPFSHNVEPGPRLIWQGKFTLHNLSVWRKSKFTEHYNLIIEPISLAKEICWE